MFVAHDVEVVKGGKKYRVSDNPFTLQDLCVVSYDVSGAGYNREFETIDRINGRFITSTQEESKTVNLTVSYRVDRAARGAHLKSEIQNLFSGEFYLRELAVNDNTIGFLGFNDKDKDFEIDYVDGRQIYVGLKNEISFDTTQTYGTIELEFETIALPYFESIAYNTELEKMPSLNYWAIDDDVEWSTNSIYRRHTFDNVQDDFYYYLGDVPVKQFNQDYEVKITLGKDTKGFTFYIGNNDIMTIYDIELKAGDVIKYDGLRVYRNNLAIDEYTNGVQPVISPGSNHFHFNQDVQQITFKTKLYFR